MSAVKGRKSKAGESRGDATKLLQGRVSPRAHDAARAAADAAGISIASYLEALVLADEEHHLVRPKDVYHQEVLSA